MTISQCERRQTRGSQCPSVGAVVSPWALPVFLEHQPHPAIDHSTAIGDVQHVGRDGTGELAFGGSSPSFLDGEEVGEVSIDESFEHTQGGLFAVVVDRNVLTHTLADVTATEDHQCGVSSAG